MNAKEANETAKKINDFNRFKDEVLIVIFQASTAGDFQTSIFVPKELHENMIKYFQQLGYKIQVANHPYNLDIFWDDSVIDKNFGE